MQQLTIDILMVNGDKHQGLGVIVADQVLYSTTARKHKWGTPEQDPFLFQNFLAYAVAKRTGRYTGTWDDFCRDAAAVALHTGDDLDPTAPTTGGI